MRILVAGAKRSPLSDAVVEYVRLHPRADLAGVSTTTLTPSDVRDSATDLLLSAAHPYFIDAALRAIPRLGAVGLHPSLLPRYRGSYPLWWALRDGEPEAGLTLFHLVDEIDAGPILGQRRVPIAPGDTFASLYARVVREAPPLLDGLLDSIVRFSAVPAGDAQDQSLATYVRMPSLVPRVGTKASLALRAIRHGRWPV